jgi:hypothetical protein
MDPQSAGVVDASIGDRRVRLGADGTIAVRPADGA